MVKKYIAACFLILIVLFVSIYAENTMVLELDKSTYEGLSDDMEITLNAPELNKSIRISEQAFAKVTTTDNSSGISLFLCETGVDTGVFKGTVHFSLTTSNAAENTIKIRNDSILYVQCKGMTAEAVWVAYDANLEFNGETYSGLGAVPKITLTDYDLNSKQNIAEEVQVIVKSTSDSSGISVTLKEDSSDSGVFEGLTQLTTGLSDTKENRLHVEYNDEITVTYIDAINSGNSEQLCTAEARWEPQTAAITLSSAGFSGLNSKCKVTVTDSDMSKSKDVKETAFVKIVSDSDPVGISVRLYETGEATGVFSTDIHFSRYSSSSVGSTIKVGADSSIKASYCDDWNDLNKRYTTIEETAAFKFVKGTLNISNSSQYSANGSITITVTDPDADTNNQKNTIPINVLSYASGKILTLWLEETGVSSGSFKGNLYFSAKPVSDKTKKDITMLAAQGDELEISYNDITVLDGQSMLLSEKYTWSHQKAEVILDKSEYVGYNSSAILTINDSEANKSPKTIDKVRVKISGTSMPEFNMVISESKADSGQFKGTLYFGKQGNHSKGMIRTAAGDIINVVYEDQGEYSFGTIETTAVWESHDAEIKLDSSAYYGNNAEVDITVEDWDVGKSVDTKDNIFVFVGITGKPLVLQIRLQETGKSTGIYTGSLSINSTSSKHVRLNLLNGDELEVKYLDVHNAENKKVELKASATWNLEK